MKAVARLVFSYFTCTPMLRASSAVGLVTILVSAYVLGHQHQGEAMLWLAFFGPLAFYIGSALMPLMFGRMARSHLIRVLPYGRIKLLVSAYTTILIVSLPMAALMYLGYSSATAPEVFDPVKYEQWRQYVNQAVWLVFLGSIVMAGWLYLAMWFITSQRSIAGYVKGLLVIMFIIYAPTHTLPPMVALRSCSVRAGA